VFELRDGMSVLILSMMRHIAPEMPITRYVGQVQMKKNMVGMITRGSLGRKYYRQRSLDGELYSVCLQCFLTVATAEDEEGLAQQEGIHECEGFPQFQDAPVLH